MGHVLDTRLRELREKKIVEEELHPREMYLLGMLESVEHHWDDLADQRNMLRAANDFIGVVMQQIDDTHEYIWDQMKIDNERAVQDAVKELCKAQGVEYIPADQVVNQQKEDTQAKLLVHVLEVGKPSLEVLCGTYHECLLEFCAICSDGETEETEKWVKVFKKCRFSVEDKNLDEHQFYSHMAEFEWDNFLSEVQANVKLGEFHTTCIWTEVKDFTEGRLYEVLGTEGNYILIEGDSQCTTRFNRHEYNHFFSHEK